MPVRFFSESVLRDPVARRAATKSRILFVEGPDELWFFDHLLSELGASPNEVQLIDYEGTGHFERHLTSLLKEDIFLDDGVRALGIIQDADRKRVKRTVDLEGKYAKIIGTSKVPVGKMAKAKQESTLMVGAFLLPRGDLPGNLDSLLIETISDKPAMNAAREYMSAHDDSHAEDQDKRISQVYLATRKELRRGSGQASRDGYFDLSHDALSDLRKFLDEFLNA